MKKQRLVLYVEPRTLMVIEQLAAMEDSSVSAFAASYLDRIAKNNDEKTDPDQKAARPPGRWLSLGALILAPGSGGA